MVSRREEDRRAWIGMITPHRTRGVSRESCADIRERAIAEKNLVSSSPFSMRQEMRGMTCLSMRWREYCIDSATVPMLEAHEARTSESVATGQQKRIEGRKVRKRKGKDERYIRR
jgi:hypothetical protein